MNNPDKTSTWTRREWLVLAAVGLPLMVGAINLFGTTLALTQIQQDFAVGFDLLRWIIVAFLVPDLLLLLVGGRYGDFFGRRRLILAGAVIFAVGAGLSAVAPSYWFLIVTRIVEGAGAGFMFSGLLAVIADTFPERRLGAAFGIWALIGALAFGVSPLIAGSLVDGVGWRYIFVLNGVVAILTAALIARLLDDDTRGDRPAGDPVGLITIGAGVSLLAIGLLQGPSWGWSSAITIALLLAGAVSLGIGILVETRVENPFWHPQVIRSRNFLPGTLVVAIIYLAQEMTVLIVVFYLVFVRDVSLFETGLVLLAYSILWLLISPWSGRLSDRIGALPPILAGLAVAGAGAFVIAFGMTNIVGLCIGLALLAVGHGFAIAPANAAAMRQVPASLRGEASGINMMLRISGAVVGIAAGASLLQWRNHSIVSAEVAERGADPGLLRSADLGGLLETPLGVHESIIDVFANAGELQSAAESAFKTAASTTFIIAGALYFCVLIICVATLRDKQHQ